MASVATVTALNRRIYLETGPGVEVSTQGFDGEDAVIFNRAVASSQAFSRKFAELDDEIQKAKDAGTLGTKTLPQKALNWLSRGLVEKIESFLKEALDGTWAIDLAIYEYHLPRLHDAIVAAAQRGVHISRAASILESYAVIFETLISTWTDRSATKRWINKHNELPTAPERFAGFSPRAI